MMFHKLHTPLYNMANGNIACYVILKILISGLGEVYHLRLLQWQLPNERESWQLAMIWLHAACSNKFYFESFGFGVNIYVSCMSLVAYF